MDYQNTDDAIRREACEQVKQIVKAIKAIKIKYYTIFSRISPEDKEKYLKLEENLERISNSHNLNNLKVALMSEVDAKYDRKDDDIEPGTEMDPDDILQACYGAIDAEQEALSKGRIAQAIRCQEQLKKYKQQLDSKMSQVVTIYKREKFAELGKTREQVEEMVQSWNNQMKGMYKIKHVSKRKETMEAISEGQNVNKKQQENSQEETITI